MAVGHAVVEVTERLEALGLEAGVLRDAVLQGEAARDSYTANDARLMPGTAAWNGTLRSLREALGLQGWRKGENGALETVVNPAGTIALTVATGNAGTGDPMACPRTKNPRGPATVAAVGQNNVQLELFDVGSLLRDARRKEPRVNTYVLLVHRTANEVRLELSLPVDFDERGRIATWRDRIILEPIRLDAGPEVPAPIDPGEEIDVPVRRKET